MWRRKLLFVAFTGMALVVSSCSLFFDQADDAGDESNLNAGASSSLDTLQGTRGQIQTLGAQHYNAGNVMYRMGEFQESLPQYDEALMSARGELRSRAFFNRGNAAFRAREYAQAVEAYKEVLRMNPDHLDAKHNLELALKQMPPQGRDVEQASPEAQPPQTQPPPQAQPPPQSQDDTQASPEAQPPQTEPLTEEQARQALEAVGENAKTLAEGRQQVLVSPKLPPEFPW